MQVEAFHPAYPNLSRKFYVPDDFREEIEAIDLQRINLVAQGKPQSLAITAKINGKMQECLITNYGIVMPRINGEFYNAILPFRF